LTLTDRAGRAQADLPDEGRRRVVVEGLTPLVDGGRFPAKRVLGDQVVIEADVFADGHDVVVARARHRAPGSTAWLESPMTPLGNDRWRGRIDVGDLGLHHVTVAGWVDAFATWQRDLGKRVQAGQDVAVDLLVGAGLVEAAAERASEPGQRGRLAQAATTLRGAAQAATAAALDPELTELMDQVPDRRFETVLEPAATIAVDPVHARFSSWYELFPRSAAAERGRHGTLGDVVERLPYVAAMGFDVLYLPPIHPIGRTFRKGPNNQVTARPGDPGVPWAIGGPEGGHTAVHPELGTLADVRALVDAAGEHGIRIALDLAFQASPDHPYVREHRAWFRSRPDGTIQYAENPPKKYQDIYPFDFESEDWAGMWQELLAVVRFWVDQGVRIFRVDNPHTKAFPFWQWLIAEIKRDDPDVLFLAEAFTRPKVMYRLAKLGFSQSYTYFTWRTTKHELTEYFEELTSPPASELFRPNVWPNTPDILHEVLQHGGRPAFALRLVLGATLAASYGIYGPAYELAEATPREPGSEEYLDSEKYEIRHWDLEQVDSLAPLITRVNMARREHPALQRDDGLTFHDIDNERLIAYSKQTADGSDLVLTIVNLDPHHVQTGWVELPLETLGIDPERSFEVHDLLDGSTYLWDGPRNYVELDPAVRPGHVLHVRPRLRSEAEFEYYL
jgi:starch synthase (maltosyl-transferring)